MITAIKNANYSFLFQDASEELVRLHFANKLGENSLTDLELDYLLVKGEDGQPLKDKDGNYVVNRFTSLEQYFTRIGTLVAHAEHPIKYLMLPLDEPCVEVDANTRNITIPKEFKNRVVSVQGDVIAETLFLRIDRYFDSMDFLETEAYIQWEVKNGGKQGASRIPYIDYESEHAKGKLILVWPLTGAVTEKDGDVSFSLRFLKRKGDQVVYSWNSATATIAIQKALKSDFDYTEFDDGSLLFKQAIENSKHTSEKEDPDSPAFFEYVLLDAPEKNAITHLRADNTLSMHGQAAIEDQGRLTYAWKYTGLGGTPVAESPAIVGAKAAAFKETTDTAMDVEKHKVYYLENSDAQPYGYEQIKNADEFEAAVLAGEKIFERHATLTIASDKGPVEDRLDVTGKYELIATNKLGFNSNDTILAVTIPGPIQPTYTSGDENKGLHATGTFIVDGAFKEFDETDKPTIPGLQISVVNDKAPASAYQSMTYVWERNVANDSEEGTWEVVKTNVYDNSTEGKIGKADDVLELEAENMAPGWYRVITTSMLNRDKKSEPSNIARVTNLPVAPQLTFPFSDAADNIDMVDADSAEFQNRQVVLNVATVEGCYPAPIELNSDELIYEWRVEQTPIEEGADGFSGLGTATLTIDGTKFKSEYMNIDCLVSNKLNGRISGASRSGIFMVSF